jgi:adenine-specific DNA-methyltransferase
MTKCFVDLEGLVRGIVHSLECPNCHKQTMELVLSDRLNSLAKYDGPKISGKTGIRDYGEKEKSVFCSKRTVGSALLKLLNGLNTKYIILSYNSEGLLSKDEITEIFKKSKLNGVKLYEFPYRRFKSNHNSHNDKVKEYIFMGKVIK